jgi:hypothetical protein
MHPVEVDPLGADTQQSSTSGMQRPEQPPSATNEPRFQALPEDEPAVRPVTYEKEPEDGLQSGEAVLEKKGVSRQ